jgi:hypothetical protein
MMKKIVVFFAALVVALALNSALAEDYNPPTWRGDALTTYQRWEFSSDVLPSPPEADLFNTLEDPVLTVTDPATRLWMPEDSDGTTGVWKFEDTITIDIANFEDQNPLKIIWIQMTYSASGMPTIYADDPAGGRFFAQLMDQTPVAGTLYLNATWQITMEPNPPSETIVIQPRDCTTYVDEIVIDTICTVPEPMTVCLLGLGALALLRKRRP